MPAHDENRPDEGHDDGGHPDVGPASTMRQERLTALERETLHRAIMARLALLDGGPLATAVLADLPPATRRALTGRRDPHEAYRLRQLLERFSH